MAVKPEFEDKLADGYHSLMLSYAAGRLNQAENLIVSAHISMSEKGRRVLARYESICGSLLENECDPAPMSDDSMQNLMSLIDSQTQETPKISRSEFFENLDVPMCLHGTLSEQKKRPRWSSVMPGLDCYIVEIECKKNKIEFLRAEPALVTPTHEHDGMEITLVLDGAYIDETGKYEVGDLFVLDEDVQHAPSACPELGCVCMVVSTVSRKNNPISRLLGLLLGK